MNERSGNRFSRLPVRNGAPRCTHQRLAGADATATAATRPYRPELAHSPSSPRCREHQTLVSNPLGPRCREHRTQVSDAASSIRVQVLRVILMYLRFGRRSRRSCASELVVSSPHHPPFVTEVGQPSNERKRGRANESRRNRSSDRQRNNGVDLNRSAPDRGW